MANACEICGDPTIDGRRCRACRLAMANPPLPTFEIGTRVQPRGGGLVVGEIIEFNAPCTGALIRWNNGEEIWKALRNLECAATPSPLPQGQREGARDE